MGANKEFTPYELALKLKQIGFDEEGYGLYRHGELVKKPKYITNSMIKNIPNTEMFCVAPLWQQAFDYFRIEKKLHCVIYDVFDENNKLVWDFDIIDNNSEEEEYDIPLSDTYEEARLKCLTKLIEIVENGK